VEYFSFINYKRLRDAATFINVVKTSQGNTMGGKQVLARAEHRFLASF